MPVTDGETPVWSHARVIAVLLRRPFRAPVHGPAEMSHVAGNSNLAIWPVVPDQGPGTG